MMNRITNILVLWCLLVMGTSAQPTYRATLPVVRTTGFYKIDLPYQVVGASSSDLADVRIKDENGKEVAWMLRKDEVRISRNDFIPFPAHISRGKNQTEVMVETSGKPVSSFMLRIKNTDSDKKAFLQGSYDRKAWYSVSEHVQLKGINNPTDTEAFIELKFPLSDYPYYKITIKDSLSSPLNIIGVGCLQNESSVTQRLMNIPLKNYKIHENGKYTEINVDFPFKYHLSELVFYISAPLYYQRDIRFLPSHREKILKGSGGKPVVVACPQYTDSLIVHINNGDDRPLVVDSVKVYGPKYHLIAHLEEGLRYFLTYGDKNADFPQYDLSFSMYLSDSIAAIQPTEIQSIPLPEPVALTPWTKYLKTYGLWGVIIFIIVQILYVVRKLLAKGNSQ